jgi:hypothetical protein
MALDTDADKDSLTLDQRREFIREFWPCLQSSPLSDKDLKGWQAYFQHYTTEVRSAIQSNGGLHTTIRKHRDVVAIAQNVQRGLAKQAIKEQLHQLDTQGRSAADKERIAEGSINLVVRLLFMVDIGLTSPNHIPSLTCDVVDR